MSKWNNVRLIDIAGKENNSFIDGDWIEAPYLCENGIRLIQTGNIGCGFFKDNNKKYISEESFTSLNCKEVKTGDILICRLAEPIGRSCKVPNLPTKNITSVDVTIFRIDSIKYHSDFILQVINTTDFLRKANEVSGGSTRQRISRSKLGNLKILIPESLPEQRKIAQILSTTDSVIEKTQAAIAKYKALKQGMLHDLFTRGIDVTTGKLRPKQQDAPELYKESKLGWIPMEWGMEVLEKLTEKIGSGITPTGGSEIYTSSGVLFIRSQNVLIGSLLIENAAFITNEIDEMMQSSRVKPFDILLNITGASIGRCAYFPSELKAANVNQHVCIIRFLNISKELSVFASEFLNSGFGQSQINRLNAGGNREGLNFQQIKSFSFPVINPIEIKIISKTIEIITKKITTEQTYLQKLQMLKSGLMNDLLSGKKEVKLTDNN